MVRTSVKHAAIALCATFLFSPHFDVICDLLPTATSNLFVNLSVFFFCRKSSCLTIGGMCSAVSSAPSIRRRSDLMVSLLDSGAARVRVLVRERGRLSPPRCMGSKSAMDQHPLITFYLPFLFDRQQTILDFMLCGRIHRLNSS